MLTSFRGFSDSLQLVLFVSKAADVKTACTKSAKNIRAGVAGPIEHSGIYLPLSWISEVKLFGPGWWLLIDALLLRYNFTNVLFKLKTGVGAGLVSLQMLWILYWPMSHAVNGFRKILLPVLLVHLDSDMRFSLLKAEVFWKVLLFVPLVYLVDWLITPVFKAEYPLILYHRSL